MTENRPSSRLPPFDPTGVNGPRNIIECTESTQIRYQGGPEVAGGTCYLVFAAGPWFASEDGRAWLREDEDR